MLKVSVIMGIYNCADTLPASIESILNQTYTDWNLIICDDGSTDDTFTVAYEYSQNYENILLFKNEQNMGLNYTLNKCLQHANGEYIARMDGDDISMPTRFEREVQYLDHHPDIAFVSTAIEYFNENGVCGRNHPKIEPQLIDFARSTPFCHAPCMVRKTAFSEVGGYSIDKKLLRVEDYHLWYKMYKQGFRGINLAEPLYQMRDDMNAAIRRKFKFRINEAYIKWLVCKDFHLPFPYYLLILKPLFLGLIPKRIYVYLHKSRVHISSNNKTVGSN